MNMEDTSRLTDKKNKILFTISFFLFVLIGYGIYAFLCYLDMEPSGKDVWAHIYKSQIMYENLSKGIFYPLYADDWYNGIQLYRYWPPLAYYIIAGLQFMVSGNVIHAYYAFIAFIFMAGAIPFAILGYRLKRPYIGFISGALFFAMPDNYKVILSEGNAARMITSVITVYLIYFLWEYMTNDKRWALIGLAVSMTLMTFGHLMITAMIGVGAFIYLLFDYIYNKQLKKTIIALSTMVSGIMVAGIWFVPATMGGMLSTSSENVSEQPMWSHTVGESLDGLYRIFKGADTYYFGLAVFMVACLGVLLAVGKRKAGFFVTVAILFIISPAVLSVVKHIPLGSFFWMSRYSALAYVCLLMAFIQWDKLKIRYQLICVLLLVADCVIEIACTETFYEASSSSVEAHVESTVLKENTDQRACNMDRSKYGSYPAWNLVSGENPVDYSYGWAWQGASTASNIMSMNEALENEQYSYVFDRSIELGDDAVLVKIYEDINVDKLEEAAANLGYTKIYEGETGIIYKLNAPKQFGVKTFYEGIAVGKYATMFTEYYPLFEVGASCYIDEYSVEELSCYTSIFLSGFEYNDKQRAEEIIRDVAATGTRIIMDVSHLPGNALKQPYFMGINAYTITYNKFFPTLHYLDKSLVPSSFAGDDSDWKAMYANNYDTVLGYVYEDDKIIPFMGYDSSNPDVYFVGLNMVYYAQSVNREDIWEMLDDCFRISHAKTPVRELVNISVEVSDNSILIHCDEDDVNTTLAYQDNFVSDQAIYARNNLLHVNKGDTLIKIKYPHLALSALVSVIGVIACIGCILWDSLYRKKLSMNG